MDSGIGEVQVPEEYGGFLLLVALTMKGREERHGESQSYILDLGGADGSSTLSYVDVIRHHLGIKHHRCGWSH